MSNVSVMIITLTMCPASRLLLSWQPIGFLFSTPPCAMAKQGPGFSLHVEEKLALARALDALGVDIMEAGFPIASPKDAEAVRRIATEIRRPTIAALGRCRRLDLEKTFWALEPAAPPRVHIVLATSDLHLEKKLNMTRGQCIDAPPRRRFAARTWTTSSSRRRTRSEATWIPVPGDRGRDPGRGALGPARGAETSIGPPASAWTPSAWSRSIGRSWTSRTSARFISDEDLLTVVKTVNEAAIAQA